MHIEQGGYPTNKDGKGIIFQGVPERGRFIIPTTSGKVVTCDSGPTHIRIYPEGNFPFGLAADINSAGIITLGIRTEVIQNNEKIRHPDLFASKFVQFVVHNFEKRGLTINGFYGKWGKNSLNFKEFHTTYAQTHNKVEAAKSTWTGKTLIELGFTQVEEEWVHISESMIDTQFLKP